MISISPETMFAGKVHVISKLTLQTTKLWTRSLADDKISIKEIMIFVFHKLESIVGQGENACYENCLLFPQ